ncbi:hypothetical protein [Sabulicella rubraurantiaca]|uniref:hypothetical protein n=1 Tax=Sabulicella rubraurantiaca TaxID=2811429 RepID=UPI001A96B44F|nr:hypothetical protein [Sabulicella rubraurantiaca]
MKPRRPTGTEWADFRAKMQEAAQQFAEDDIGRAGDTSGAVAALEAVQDMMQACGFPTEHWNVLHRLVVALSDLKEGREVAPILRPAPRKGRGPRGVGTDVLVQRGTIAALLHECLERKAFASREEAARWVARKAANVPSLHDQRGTPWRIVARWREDAMAGNAEEDHDSAVFHATKHSLAAERDLPLEAVAKAILRSATHAGGPVKPAFLEED